MRQEELALNQGVFSTFLQKQEHVVGDLFEPHALKPGLWHSRGGVDNLISFTTAEKLSIIRANPLVRPAVIGGQGQFQASPPPWSR